MPSNRSILSGLALALSFASALANPFDHAPSLVKRQAILPPTCSNFTNADCGVAECLIRPTNCTSPALSRAINILTQP
jgi:hypothetical protein